ncbi:sialate O-acetylesterase [Spirosoma utsteinense]|uniref:Repeat protein (TIGR01451 family) n=1 Tax=Spirosoma utsteinense TaxID=2585773 RepID=A0ABR6W408_9BACT|nr:sialate O-acetylesterase [Spirosoma utsteinense]MBC3784771.1 putative repeat protein (TIGR01451 family) [Spirosoma utsteinense]MBC3791192.1 putative repeat protein (TIGR01451 family) [Spirosoma utsteinense]
MPLSVKWVLLFISWPVFAVAQLQISYPLQRLVVQRGADGNGRLYVSGRLTGAADRVEAQLTPASAGQGTATGWQTVQTNPTNSLFLGFVTGAGGWYVLTVRTLVNNVETARATVQPVGIGEVFITAGQSNSRGLGSGDNDLGTATDRVNAIDSINHSYPPGAKALVSSGDPSPVPVFKPLTAGRRVFPMAESSWGWGELGDYVVNRYNVPVAFYVAGWDGSTIENWINSANGIPTCNRYYCVENWPNLQPYTNLKNVLTYYASMAGVRAVLWHQGEAEYGDAGSGSIPDYRNRLTALIQKTRQDFGGRNLPWMVARASFDGTTSRSDVINAQQQVIDTPGLNVFQGPYNDTLINRNAGTTDVHFRNSQRPSPHPRYYLNPNSIPVDMGLSRFARNWNNSLNNAFFQNAQPITPTQFAVTGILADYVRPGDSLRVSFSTIGTLAATQWQVQLLDSLGQYKAILGSGPSSPVRVKLPADYQSGRFQVRVVSASLSLAAVPSNLFRITTNPPTADLSLGMGVSQRTPDVNTPVTITLFVRNDGVNTVTNVVVRNRLPTNVTVVSTNGLTLNGTVLTGTIGSLSAGATATLSFAAQPTAAATYRNAAEIIQSSLTDPDSQPNSGTGDGQDDAASLDFRTRESSSALFASPNPDQVPLPAVASNQPVPDPAKADVSLGLLVNNRAPALNSTITYTVTLSNRGGQTATGLTVSVNLPAGQTFVPGDDFSFSNGVLVGGLSSLAVSSSGTLRFRTQVTALGQGSCTAQVAAASQPDPDSVPGNGIDNGEDDAARIDVRVR